MSARPTHPLRADRGEASSQTVILLPVVVLLALLTVQLAIYFHASNVAVAAANGGAAAGSPRGKGPGAARGAAVDVATENGGEVASVSVQAGSDTVAVTVTLRVTRVVPFFPATVSRRSIEPRERFIAESDR